MATMDQMTPIVYPSILTGSLQKRYKVIVVVKTWIGFYIPRKFFMIIFTLLSKLFKPKLDDTID
ncbi:hypothetical protein L873DRAFT_1818090 [Choiromyces venosus 120613-1]|uniref:Uncharacterized protein n=1 Tax=Choiromyces venosus 120613-1 TaxID=1336337 RepID=A0A3N4J1E3_9PEZI|nr:hypothetical protein L873DRAFT_1818090 [Choiromyces venosus 120613-1]